MDPTSGSLLGHHATATPELAPELLNETVTLAVLETVAVLYDAIPPNIGNSPEPSPCGGSVFFGLANFFVPELESKSRPDLYEFLASLDHY